SLDGLTHATRTNVHWGMLIGNHLRVISVDELLTVGPDSALHERSRLIRLGNDSDGAGDPNEVALLSDGGLVVALSGVGEVAIRPSRESQIFRPSVGRRPTALALKPDGETLFVADTLDDTISVVGIYTGTRRAIIPLGPRPEPDLTERGERLFYDAKLSH